MKTRLILTSIMMITLISQDVTAYSGDTLWTGFYGSYTPEIAYSVKEAPDGGFIIAGYAVTLGVDNKDFYLVRTDPQGNLLWTRTYGGDF